MWHTFHKSDTLQPNRQCQSRPTEEKSKELTQTTYFTNTVVHCW